MAAKLHHRTASQDDDDSLVIASDGANGSDATPPKGLPAFEITPPRPRLQSSPAHSRHSSHDVPTRSTLPPSSAGPYQTSFPMNGLTSPIRGSFSNDHIRTRSISTPYSPAPPSPLSRSFSAHERNTSMKPSTSLPLPGSVDSPTNHSRRHSRLHSRNLSLFFPRPGSLPQSTIAEDGAQELHLHEDEEVSAVDMPTTSPLTSSRTKRGGGSAPFDGAGFTFGGRPPGTSPSLSHQPSMRNGMASRRGHHHKHSLSHNFFSFLEPGADIQSKPEDLQTQPTLTPMSPWTARDGAFPTSPMSESSSHGSLNGVESDAHASAPPGAIALTFGQFMLGAWLWVSGQQIGSLAATGLGYWVVFDSTGMMIAHLLPLWLRSKSQYSALNAQKTRRPYGNARVETVTMFAQAVYLMFAAVYILKETVEHSLLSAGGEDAHHHHHHSEDYSTEGIDFPSLLTLISLLSIIFSAVFFENHSNLVNTTGDRLPPLREVIQAWKSPSRYNNIWIHSTPTSSLGIILSNPYVCSPVLFCIALLAVPLLIPSTQHRTCDLLLATAISVITFVVSYRASTVLGTVLLQTSPRRGLPGGKMEGFLRVMREVERHPQVLHLPAPHLWQLTPAAAVSGNGKGTSGPLIVTLELHVKEDLGDDDVLKLTKWAWEKCVAALGGSSRARETSSPQVEVTVGVVRG